MSNRVLDKNTPTSGVFGFFSNLMLILNSVYGCVLGLLNGSCQVVTIPTGVFFHRTILQLYDPIYDPIEKITIVRNHEYGPIELIQSVLQNFSEGNVQIIGRFIEKQEISI